MTQVALGRLLCLRPRGPYLQLRPPKALPCMFCMAPAPTHALATLPATHHTSRQQPPAVCAPGDPPVQLEVRLHGACSPPQGHHPTLPHITHHVCNSPLLCVPPGDPPVQLEVRRATTPAELRAAAYLRAASFYKYPEDRSPMAQRVGACMGTCVCAWAHGCALCRMGVHGHMGAWIATWVLAWAHV